MVTSDLKGSTALGEKLDPESLREVLTRYFDEMRVVFESHGGLDREDHRRRDRGRLRARRPGAMTTRSAPCRPPPRRMRVLTALNDQLEERWGVRLITRTGVATGEVIVGDATAPAARPDRRDDGAGRRPWSRTRRRKRSC